MRAARLKAWAAIRRGSSFIPAEQEERPVRSPDHCETVTEVFTLEWSGGVAEHHYRKARPEDAIPWETLDARRYSEPLLAQAREIWTGVALSEYAAIAAFSEVVSALVTARAPLDLIGMTSDFLADEVYHVELASRLLMQLGGAATKTFEPAELAPRPAAGLTPRQRANELALRVGCIAETFASATAVPMMRETTHPVVRAVYQTILRDEARHRRFGSLYFEWASPALDGAECERLGHVAIHALSAYAPLWRNAAQVAEAPAKFRPEEIHELGWIEPAPYVVLARHAVTNEIIPELEALGVVLPAAELAALLA